MPDATFATPDVTTFCRLDELGLVVVGQHLQPDRAVLACRVADDAVEEADRWCRRCGCEGRPAGHRHPSPGARAAGLAADDAAALDPPLPVRWLRACVARGHQPRRGAAGEADPHRAAVGAGRAGLPAPHRRASRRGPRGVVEHRQHRRARRGPARPARRPDPLRRRAGDRRRRARVAAHPPRRQVRHRRHRPDPGPGQDRPVAAAGHGRRPLQAGVQAWLASRPRPGATAWRSSRWTGSPDSRPPPPNSCPRRRR